MTSSSFDGWVAQRYDTPWPERLEPAVLDAAVDRLAGLAGSGPVLELGIGTGRLALPLSRRGLRVHGVEISPAMVAALRAKPGAKAIGVTLGDLASASVDQTFPRLGRGGGDTPWRAGRDLATVSNHTDVIYPQLCPQALWKRGSGNAVAGAP